MRAPLHLNVECLQIIGRNFYTSAYTAKILSGLDVKPEDIGENEFKRNKKLAEEKRKMKGQLVKSAAMMLPPRSSQMHINQDWPSVWPVPASYKPSIVPLPLRQGRVSRKKPLPSNIGNLELMKIPNFLHLTPPAIKRQCEAIKKFCTSWPTAFASPYKNRGLIPFQNTGANSISGVYGLDNVKTEQLLPPSVNNPYVEQPKEIESLSEDSEGKASIQASNAVVEILTKADEDRIRFENCLSGHIALHYPIEITTTDYCFSGPSSKDNRARKVTMDVYVEALKLDYHGTDKLLRLVKERYDPESKKFTIKTDRCPLRAQNKDYAYYLLTALFHESKSVEPWEENGKSVKDLEMYFWYKMPSSDSVVQTVRNLKRLALNKDVRNDSSKDHIKSDNYPSPTYLNEVLLDASKEEVCQVPFIREYAKMVTKYHDSPSETDDSVRVYKENVKKLLGLPLPPNIKT